MPYLFDSLEEFRALVDAMWDQNNEWAIKEGGCRLLCILDIGYRQLTTSAKHPVRKLADAKGIKIRTPQNALMVSTFKALGLEPVSYTHLDVYKRQIMDRSKPASLSQPCCLAYHATKVSCSPIHALESLTGSACATQAREAASASAARSGLIRRMIMRMLRKGS